MKSGPYQLYAFEFFVSNLTTSLEFADVQVEVKLFNAPTAVITPDKSGRCPPNLNGHRHTYDTDDADTLEVEQSEKDPFILDMRSAAEIAAEKGAAEEEEVGEEEEFLGRDVMCESEAEESEGVEQMDSSVPKKQTDGKEGEDPPEEEDLEDGKKVDDRPLRMFPEDPTGMPYHKKVKGAKDKKAEETAEKSVPKPPVVEQETPTAEVSEGQGQPKEGEPAPEVPDETQNEKEIYTVLASSLEEVRSTEELADDPKPEGEGMTEDETKSDKPKIPCDYFGAGVTILLPMRPMMMLYMLQRVPLHVRVCSADRRFVSEGFLDLWPLYGCVIQAERGPPTPVFSSCPVVIAAGGDFDSRIFSVIKLQAFGEKNITRINSTKENPNDKMNHERLPEREPYEGINTDVHNAPPIVSSPECLPRRDPRPKYDVKEDEDKLIKKEKNYCMEDIVFCPSHRLVTPQAKDTYETMRWKIDRILGLTNVSLEEYKSQEEGGRASITPAKKAEEEPTELQTWNENKRRNLRCKLKDSRKERNATRKVIQKILKCMEAPTPIELDTAAADFDTKGKEENKDKEIGKLKFLYEEIRRQQQEEIMIKSYKRLFRKMLRYLDEQNGIKDVNELRERMKKRKTLQNLLVELESYQAEQVEMAFVKVMQKEKRKAEKEWDADAWPNIFGEEDQETCLEEEACEEETVGEDLFADGEELPSNIKFSVEEQRPSKDPSLQTGKTED